MRLLCLLSAVFMLFALPAARAGNKAGDYLKDGKLKERIEICELQGGFVGFTGNYYAIEPDGSWSTGAVGPAQKKGEPAAKGKLTGKQLAVLAKELARHDLASLPNHGKPVVNPKVISVRFGKKLSELLPGRGQSSEAKDKAIRARYAGIVRAVKTLCKEPKK